MAGLWVCLRCFGVPRGLAGVGAALVRSGTAQNKPQVTSGCAVTCVWCCACLRGGEIAWRPRAPAGGMGATPVDEAWTQAQRSEVKRRSCMPTAPPRAAALESHDSCVTPVSCGCWVCSRQSVVVAAVPVAAWASWGHARPPGSGDAWRV